MTAPRGKTPRWLHLVAYLLDHRFAVTREDIFEHVAGYRGTPESVRRKFERDKDELRKLGIEIETVQLPGSAGDENATGYRLRPKGTYLPYFEVEGSTKPEAPYQLDHVVLSGKELAVLDRTTQLLSALQGTSLGAAALSARRKLAFDLPLDSESVKRILSSPLPERARKTLAILQDAVLQHAAITCEYRGHPQSPARPCVVEPWGLIFQWGRWYCVGKPRPEGELLLLRVDYMREAVPLSGDDAGFDVPPAFDVRSFAGRPPWEFGPDETIRVTASFRYPEAGWILNRKEGRLVRDAPYSSAVLEFQVRDRDPFLRWLLSFGQRVEVREPASFADALRSLRAAVATLYGVSEP